MSDKRLYEIALSLVPKVGPVTAKTLVSYCGSAEAVFLSNKRALNKIPGIGPAIAAFILNGKALSLAERELLLLERHDIDAVFYTDSLYPGRLRQNLDCPILIYVKGDTLSHLNAGRILGIVGTRQPTDAGRLICEKFVDELSTIDITVVSGLAYGVDITSHRRAIFQGVSNMAVLGHGLGFVYPHDHRPSARHISENGALISEYPFETQPDPAHFPMRNRIIAGMCDALLVIETKKSGGSMITADLADQYGREVFAVPGRVGDAKSAGCNKLIKHNKARLCESAKDLARIMRWDEDASPGLQTRLFDNLSEKEMVLINLIREEPDISIDRLSMETGMYASELAMQLLDLEMQGLIRTLPGKRYRLVPH